MSQRGGESAAIQAAAAAGRTLLLLLLFSAASFPLSHRKALISGRTTGEMRAFTVYLQTDQIRCSDKRLYVPSDTRSWLIHHYGDRKEANLVVITAQSWAAKHRDTTSDVIWWVTSRTFRPNHALFTCSATLRSCSIIRTAVIRLFGAILFFTSLLQLYVIYFCNVNPTALWMLIIMVWSRTVLIFCTLERLSTNRLNKNIVLLQ